MSAISRLFLIGWVLCAAFLAGCASPRVQTSSAARPEKIDMDEARNMISAYRLARGRSALVLDPALENAASAQAMAMAQADTLSHTVAGTLADRLHAARIPIRAAAENVSAGYFSLADAVAGWRRSPPHNANLLDPSMRRMGIGSAYVPNSKYHVYWSLILTN